MFRISPALHPNTPALHNPAMSRASLALHPKKFAFNFSFLCGDLWCLYFLSDFWLPLERFFLLLMEFCWLVIYDFEIGAAKTSKMNHGN